MSSKPKRKRRSKSKHKSKPKPKPKPKHKPKPKQKSTKFIASCKELLQQITAIEDSHPFHKLIPTNNPLCTEFRTINTHPISFKTIKDRLYANPCHYNSYEGFNEDVKKIFNQEKRFKNYKGSANESVKKRIQKAKRCQNYWNTLTASIREYGFDVITNNRDNGSDSKEQSESEPETEIKKKNPKKRSKRQKKVLSNIKKRVRGAENDFDNGNANKKRKLNDENSERVFIADSNKDNQSKHEMDDDSKMEESKMDTVRDTYSDCVTMDSPYTPFADKSRVFKTIMGDCDDLFKGLQREGHSFGIKKKLDFGMDRNRDLERNVNRKRNVSLNVSASVHTFEIKWRFANSEEVRYMDLDSDRMDKAVKKFYQMHSGEQIKLISVTIKRHGSF